MLQHIFKVGWLLTRNYPTTTVLFYTFFLPGVVLHEVALWLMAGILNVRAESSIQIPRLQEIGQLQLNFVKLDKKAGRIKRAIIDTTPLIIAVFAIWWISGNILDIDDFYSRLAGGTLTNFAISVRELTTKPDFWLWLYLVFTISNTMFPGEKQDLGKWWRIFLIVALPIVVGRAIGVNPAAINSALHLISQSLIVLIQVIVLIIIIDSGAIIILSLIENALERFGDYHVIFQNGKMITMTQEEYLQFLANQENKQRPYLKSGAKARQPSIYGGALPVPGPPEKKPATQNATITSDTQSAETPSLPFNPPIPERPTNPAPLETAPDKQETPVPTLTPESSTTSQSKTDSLTTAHPSNSNNRSGVIEGVPDIPLSRKARKTQTSQSDKPVAAKFKSGNQTDGSSRSSNLNQPLTTTSSRFKPRAFQPNLSAHSNKPVPPKRAPDDPAETEKKNKDSNDIIYDDPEDSP